MMRFIYISILLFINCSLVGQVLPNEFFEKNVPEDTDEIYSQFGGNPVRIPFVNAKSYFAPYVRLIPISYTPTPSGNLLNRTEFVIDPNESIWYIDGLGNAIEFLSGESASEGVESDSTLIGDGSSNSILSVNSSNLFPDWSNVQNKPSNLDVNDADDFSGDYNDLDNVPFYYSGNHLVRDGRIGIGVSPVVGLHLRDEKLLIDSNLKNYTGSLNSQANVRQIIHHRNLDFLTYFSGDNITIRNNTVSGGFARSLLTFEKTDGSDYFNIGARGGGQDLQYNFIGRSFASPFLKWNGADRLRFHDLSTATPNLIEPYVTFYKSVEFIDSVKIDNTLYFGSNYGNVFMSSESQGELSLYCNSVKKVFFGLNYTFFNSDITIGFDGSAGSRLHVLQGTTGKALTVAMLGNRSHATEITEGGTHYLSASTTNGNRRVDVGSIVGDVSFNVLSNITTQQDFEVKAVSNASGVFHDGSFVYRRLNAHYLFNNSPTATTLHIEFSDDVTATSKGLIFSVHGILDDAPWQGSYYVKYDDANKVVTVYGNNEEPIGFTITSYEASSGNVAIKITKTGIIGITSTPINIQRAFDVNSSGLPDVVQAVFNSGANL